MTIRFDQNGRARSLVLVLAYLTVAGLAPAPAAQESATIGTRHQPLAASDEKVIESERFPGEPVEVEGLTVKGVRLALNEKFSAKSVALQGGGAADDWLDGLEFKVRNNSDKKITYLSLSLGFPRPGATDTSVGSFYNFSFGVDLRAAGAAATYVRPFTLAAGDSHTVKLTDKELTEIKSRLVMAGNPLPALDRVILRVGTVGYEDGVKWELGKYSNVDKHRPTDAKMIQWSNWTNEPTELVGLSVKNTEITRRRKAKSFLGSMDPKDTFDFSARAVRESGGGAEGDWLEGLKVTFKNTSPKQVTNVSLDLIFPEMEINGNWVAFQFSKGNPPEAIRDGYGLREPLTLEAGGDTTLEMTDKELDNIRKSLGERKFLLGDLNRAVIKVLRIVYADGTQWSNGKYFRPKPDKPGEMELIKN